MVNVTNIYVYVNYYNINVYKYIEIVDNIKIRLVKYKPYFLFIFAFFYLFKVSVKPFS